MGLFLGHTDLLTSSANRDEKASLTSDGRGIVCRFFQESELPPNVLFQIPEADVDHIMQPRSGAERIRRLFRTMQGQRIGRGVVATVAQQADYMKRIRGNGGARSQLREEGIIILGQYETHRDIARQLGLPVPGKGESVSARVVPANLGGPGTFPTEGTCWRLAHEDDPKVPTPELPSQ